VKKDLFTGLIAIIFVSSSALAGLVTNDQLCKDGDAQACTLAELEKKLSALGLFDVNGRYDWKFSLQTLAQIVPRDTKERIARPAQEFCTESTRVWVNQDVDTYSRMQGLVPVDRAAFRECFFNQLRIEQHAAKMNTAFQVLKLVAGIIVVLVLFAVFWYRRRLARGTRKLFASINNLGAK
jgi:hypothetical protein